MEIRWTTHAAKRIVQRRIDHEQVLEALAHFAASRVPADVASQIHCGGIIVVAKFERGRIVVITVKLPRKHRNLNRRNHRRLTSHKGNN